MAKKLTNLNYDIFYPDVFVNNTSEESIGVLMHDLCAAVGEQDFVNYFTVDVGNSANKYYQWIDE